jgi:phospholipase C
MSRVTRRVFVCCVSSIFLILCGCGGGGSSSFPTGSVQLSVQAAGGGGGTVSSNPTGINCGSACSASFSSGTQVTLTASPAANSFFAGWSGACSGTGVCKITVTQNTSVMANFSASPVLTVTLAGTGSGSVTSNPAGINCGQTCSAGFSTGSAVTLTATAGANSIFAGWTGSDCGSSPTCVVTLGASEQVTATFNNSAQNTAMLTVTLAGTGTVTSSPAGINCPQTCSASFEIGTQVTLTEAPAANSSFAGWSGACHGTASTCSVALNSSQSVTATFSGVATLMVTVAGTGTGTVSSNPAGISCPQMCSASFAAGTQVALTESPGPNSTFAGWSGGGCSGTNNVCAVALSASQQVTATFNGPTLSVSLAGNGTGTITSNPAGINCGVICSGNFALNSQVTLTESPAPNSTFAGWSVSTCSSTSSTCIVTMSGNQAVTATFSGPQNITAINHIIFMAQENRSFDHYFGALREYWAQNGYPDQPFDGLPQFNPGGTAPAIPGCNPNNPPPSDCIFDPTTLVTSYHLRTQCIENPSPSWNESHVDWDYNDPLGLTAAKLDGVVWTAGHDSRAIQPPYNDTNGLRTMGYYDGTDLNYYYFMASNFATSDNWFSPAMTRTQPNREYLIAATSQGYAYPIGTSSKDKALITSPTIFQELQAADISWKIYVNPTNSKCPPPYQASCLLALSYIQNFQWGQTITSNNIGTIGIANSDFENDLNHGTLPQVVQIEPASDAGLDEHPSDFDSSPIQAQEGAAYVSSIINAVMTSPSWKDSAFILTYDEFGGLYDHVSPYATASPDNIKPVDLLPGDICTQTSGPICDFTYTGYRVPLIVVSPYTKKNYVSHTPADSTAILKFIETRFNLSPLNNRDAAQITDMTEFFDFINPVWLTPPTPPAQSTSDPCYLNKLP